jgi:hypothetical protein
MLIKYLKNAPNAYAGDVKDIPDEQANVLILTGYAKEHPSKEAKARTKSNKADDQHDLLTPTDTDSE